jgi:RNA-directed DNA polymerase
MTALSHAGAAPHALTDWHAINWSKVHQNVRRLQARIVQAIKAGRWGKVKALQRLLTRSFSGKALAVRRVTENQGKRTPGVDNRTWNDPRQKAQAVHALKQRGYRPQPLKRVYIPKKNGKKRPLGIPTILDRAMQALYLLALQPIAETTGDTHSYGFRPERSTADAIEQCFTLLSRRTSAKWILEADIQSCFDRISHDWLLATIPMERAILQKWLKAGFMERYVLHPTEMGTPQGGLISPVLANLTLDGLQQQLHTHFPKPKAGQSPLVHLVRYADDFIITGRSKEQLQYEVLPLLEAFLHARGLELSQEKTSITHIENGFDFLGQNVRTYNGKLLIKPSKKNIQSFLEKVRGIIKDHKQATIGQLICMLNPVIRGWARYHRHVVSKKVFTSVDRAIYEAMRRWVIRRHPRKSKHWIIAKYICTSGGQRWTFHGEVEGRRVQLFRAARVTIERHTKVKGAANPFDPEWEPYFERRLGVKMASTLKGRRQLLRLWKAQEGICPVCKEKITTLTGWHNHHIVWRSLGGPDNETNRVLLHPTCHQQVHSRKVTVTKPRPETGQREA